MAEALSVQQRRAAVVHPIQYLRGLAERPLLALCNGLWASRSPAAVGGRA
jgi:hypothetical protein